MTRCVLPAARSSSTISRMKSRGFSGASMVIGRDRIHRRAASQLPWQNSAMRKTAVLATLTISLLLAPAMFAQSLDDVVANVLKEYGGADAWQKVTTIRETGTV